MTTATTLRRVTPTAALVLPASADRAAWLDARKDGVGSSDVPALMGVHVAKHGPQHVYYDKLGQLTDDNAGERALWGTLHEETVAREWARRNRTVIRRVGLVSRIDAPWMMSTLDRRCTECPLNPDLREACAVEIKTTDKMLAGRWRAFAPDYVLAQTLWQIDITGYDHIHVAVLIGGNDYRQFVVRREGNEQLIEDIRTIASRFWHDHVLAGVEPEPLGTESVDSMVDLYDRLNPDRTDVVDLTRHASAFDDLHDYENGRLAEAAGKRAKDAAKVRLLAALGPAAIAVMGGDVAYSYDASKRRAPDLERLAERWPDAYADCVVDKPQHRLSIGAQFRLKGTS